MVLESFKGVVVGADDSNHAGEKKGEVIVVIFSGKQADGISRHHSRGRNYESVKRWLNEGRDYRFTLLTDESSRRRAYNLVLIAPLLIRAYFEKISDQLTYNIHLHLDGPLPPYQRRFILNNFRYRDVKGYTKGKKGPIQCPIVVKAADVLSNRIYVCKSLEEMFADPRFVNVSTEEVLYLDNQLKNRK